MRYQLMQLENNQYWFYFFSKFVLVDFSIKTREEVSMPALDEVGDEFELLDNF